MSYKLELKVSQVPFICGKTANRFIVHFGMKPGDAKYRFIGSEVIPPPKKSFWRREEPHRTLVSAVREFESYDTTGLVCPCCGKGSIKGHVVQCGACTALNCASAAPRPNQPLFGQDFKCAACGFQGRLTGRIEVVPTTDTEMDMLPDTRARPVLPLLPLRPTAPVLPRETTKRLPPPPLPRLGYDGGKR